MWTKSKNYDVKELPVLSNPSLITSDGFKKQNTDAIVEDGLLEERSFNFISSLAYTIISPLTSDEKRDICDWVISRWGKPLECKYVEKISLSQVEYFFFGTDNGQVFIFPLLPYDALREIIDLYKNEPWCTLLEKSISSTRNSNCGPLRLLHQHAREEPINGLHHFGTLLASCSADGSVALSSFHPQPQEIALLSHPHPVSCVKLWDGSPFSAGLDAQEEERRHETAAVYVITGDQRSVIRIWRINVLEKSSVLLNVLVMTSSFVHMHSPLEITSAEDNRKASVERETMLNVHSLAIDDNKRLLAGVQGNLYCWCLERLPWKERFDTSYHPLQWCELNRDSLPAAAPASVAQVQLRAKRLVNHHVWIRDERFVANALDQWEKESLLVGGQKPTRWKPKHTRTVGCGNSVGVVSNEVETFSTDSNELSTSAILDRSLVTISFDELRNDIVVPLSCAEPVLYPLAKLKIGEAACYAIEVLKNGERLVTMNSDNCIIIWSWNGSAETYSIQLVTGKQDVARGLGKQLCILRSPDIFIASAYDDEVIREWHLYDEPEKILRSERRFSLLKSCPTANSINGELSEKNFSDLRAEGVAAMYAVPCFSALFVAALFDHTIQTFRLSETQGCEVPPTFIYNGYCTVRLPDLDFDNVC